jgi:hypothetical protein
MKNTFTTKVIKFTHKITVYHFKFRYYFARETAQLGPLPPHFWGFAITRRHATLSRTPLDGWSARRRCLYLTTNTIHKKASMLQTGFEPAILASERQHTHGWDSEPPRQTFKNVFVIISGSAAQRGLWPPRSRGFLITHNDAPVSRIPLHKWSARRRDLYLTTHNTHNRQRSMTPERFEPTIAVDEPQ